MSGATIFHNTVYAKTYLKLPVIRPKATDNDNHINNLEHANSNVVGESGNEEQKC